MNNPFQIGDYLYIHFGTRQRWQVAALSNERCAMRFPGLTCKAVLWFSVADLLRWNPDQQPKSIVPAYVPMQYPAVVPGLHVRRVVYGLGIPAVEAFTVVCVLRDTAFVRHSDLDGLITSRKLRTFWHTTSAAQTSVSYEPVTLSGAELHDIAEQWRDLRRGVDTFWKRWNRALDTAPAGWMERKLIDREYAETQWRLKVVLGRLA